MASVMGFLVHRFMIKRRHTSFIEQFSEKLDLSVSCTDFKNVINAKSQQALFKVTAMRILERLISSSFVKIWYTASWYVWGEWFLAVNHHNHRNWVPSILIHKLWLIFMGRKQKKKKNFEKKNQNGQLKKSSFFKIANSQYFLWKFTGLVFGLVGLNYFDTHCFNNFIKKFSSVQFSGIWHPNWKLHNQIHFC